MISMDDQPLEHRKEGQEMTKKERREARREERREQHESLRSARERTKWMKWVGVVVVLGAVVFGVAKLSDGPKPYDGPIVEQGDLQLTADEWSQGGDENALVTLVEYSDFQCPACRVYSTLVHDLAEHFEGDVRVVYRHFPLRSIHPLANLAAQAAEAAGAQGKFWDMHDELFASQSSWSSLTLNDAEDLFVTYAEKLELDVDKFQDDIGLGDVREAVEADYISGLGLGISGTPTFFINGEHVINPKGYEAFRATVQLEIDRAREAVQEESVDE